MYYAYTYILIILLRKLFYFAQMTDEARSKDLFVWKINNNIKANIEIVGRIMNNFNKRSEKYLTK